jgi:hypothetical protein
MSIYIQQRENNQIKKIELYNKPLLVDNLSQAECENSENYSEGVDCPE